MGFGGFLLGLLLIVGVLGLVGLLASGALDGMFNFASGAINPPPGANQQPTASATAEPQIAMPSLTNLTREQALALIQSSGLQPGGDTTGYSDTVAVQEEASTTSEGFVIRQDPLDVKLPRGQTVTLVVSIGNKVTMPDVTGKSEAEARQMIAAAGLAFSFSDVQGCDKLGAEVCNRFPPGAVVSSIPRGGDRVERDSPVTLGVRAP
jgi:beta-lactam-binding protein with PASTA domain